MYSLKTELLFHSRRIYPSLIYRINHLNDYDSLKARSKISYSSLLLNHAFVFIIVVHKDKIRHIPYK